VDEEDVASREREALQRVVRVMLEEAVRLPDESVVGGRLAAAAERVLSLLPGPPREPQRRPPWMVPTALSGLLLFDPDRFLALARLLGL
jgi:hypothetical protein